MLEYLVNSPRLPKYVREIAPYDRRGTEGAIERIRKTIERVGNALSASEEHENPFRCMINLEHFATGITSLLSNPMILASLSASGIQLRTFSYSGRAMMDTFGLFFASQAKLKELEMDCTVSASVLPWIHAPDTLEALKITYSCLTLLLPHLSIPLVRLRLTNSYRWKVSNKSFNLTGFRVLNLDVAPKGFFLQFRGCFANLRFLEMGPVRNVLFVPFLRDDSRLICIGSWFFRTDYGNSRAICSRSSPEK